MMPSLIHNNCACCKIFHNNCAAWSKICFSNIGREAVVAFIIHSPPQLCFSNPSLRRRETFNCLLCFPWFYVKIENLDRGLATEKDGKVVKLSRYSDMCQCIIWQYICHPEPEFWRRRKMTSFCWVIDNSFTTFWGRSSPFPTAIYKWTWLLKSLVTFADFTGGVGKPLHAGKFSPDDWKAHILARSEVQFIWQFSNKCCNLRGFYGHFLRPAVEGEIAFGNVNKKKVERNLNGFALYFCSFLHFFFFL